MTRSRLLPAWAGSALCLATLIPLPEPLRIVLALAAVLIAFPLASWPFWSRWLPASHSEGPRAWCAVAAMVVTSMLPAALFTSLGLAGVPLTVLAALSLFLPVLTTGLALVTLRPDEGERGPQGWPEWAASAIGPALLIIGLAAAHGTPIGVTDDAMDHIATLRHIAGENRIDFPGASYAVDLPAGQDPRKGALLTSLAIAGRLSHSDVLQVWRNSSIVIAPLMVLAYAALGFALFRKWGAALAGAMALILLWDDPFWLLRGGYGGHWGLAIAWGGTALLLAGAAVGWGILAGIATAAVHAYSPFQLLAPLILLFFARLVWKRMPLVVNGTAIIGVIIGAAPFELARRFLAGPSVNPIHAQSMDWLMLSPGPIASPLQILGWYGYAGVAALTAPFVVAAVRRDRAGIFVLASAAAPLLLLLNPWLFRPVGEWIGSVSNKLALVWAYPLAIAWTGLTIIEARKWGVRLAAVLAGVVITLALMISLPRRLEAIIAGHEPPREPLRNAMALVRDHVPADGVIASDPVTSYAIPAFTGRRTIVTLSQHAPPGDARSLKRIEAVAELYSDCVPLETALDRARREGAQYFLALDPAPFRQDAFGAHSDPRNTPVLRSRFEARPDQLRPVAHDATAVLYQILGSDFSQVRVEPEMLRRAQIAPTGGPAGQDPIVSDGTVTFTIQSLPFQSCRRGEVIRMPAAWRLEKPATDYLEYSGHIRFENEALPRIRMPFSLIAKPLRWLIFQPRSGGSYRWSDAELPFRGLCPVAAWPAGDWLADTLQVEVPSQLLPGRYRIRISLEPTGVYPVLTPADLFQEEDRFSGPVAGVMEIR